MAYRSVLLIYLFCAVQSTIGGEVPRHFHGRTITKGINSITSRRLQTRLYYYCCYSCCVYSGLIPDLRLYTVHVKLNW